MEGGANNSSGNSSGVNVIIREDNLGLPREASILMGEPARERVRERERELTVYFEGAIKSVAVSGGSDKVDTPPPPARLSITLQYIVINNRLVNTLLQPTLSHPFHPLHPPCSTSPFTPSTPFTPFTPPAQPPPSPPLCLW